MKIFPKVTKFSLYRHHYLTNRKIRFIMARVSQMDQVSKWSVGARLCAPTVGWSI